MGDSLSGSPADFGPSESYGIFSAGAVQDPYPYYQRLRELEPVHWSTSAEAWYFTRHKDVFLLQTRLDLSVDRVETLYSYLPQTERARFSQIIDHYTKWVLYRDGTYHDRLKALFMKAVTPGAVEGMRPKIQTRINTLLDELEGRDQFDAYLEFAARLPVQVIIDLLGVAASDEGMLRNWSDRCSNFMFQPVNPDREAMAAEQLSILAAQEAYFTPFIEERRARPRADMISAMVQADVEGEKLTDQEILAICNMISTAGGGTSRSAIAMALWRLRMFPDELAKLKASPNIINIAAEEFLRFEAPTQRSIRTATQTFEYEGHTIKQGQILHLMLGAANRDPEQFNDPDSLDIRRNPNRHVTFGHGLHYCLGANVARLELRLAVLEFIRRFPNYKLATDTVRFMNRTASRRPEALPIITQ